MRLFKDEYEIEQLEQTCAINKMAFNYVMSHLKPGMHEYNAEAMHKFVYLSHGARHHSFEAITAAHHNVATMHFVNNVDEIRPNQVFMLDAGCEVNCYCSDHTRTFPTSERFTEKQLALYQIVLQCNLECIKMVRPGVKWEDVHMHGQRVMLEGLRRLGIVNSQLDFEEQLAAGVSSIFQPAGLGHLIGLGTHDVGGYN